MSRCSRHHGGASGAIRSSCRRRLVVCGVVCFSGMAIRAAHLLHLPLGQLLLPRNMDFPAEVQKREDDGGDNRKKGVLHTNHLVHSSKYNWEGPTSASRQQGDLTAFVKRTRNGVLHVQDEGQGGNLTRYGGKSASCGLQLRSEAQSRKFERDQLNIVGSCRGTGIRTFMHKVKKVHLKTCKKRRSAK